MALLENARIRDAYITERRAHLRNSLEAEKLQLNQAIESLRQDVLFLSNAPPVPGIVRAALNNGYDPRYGNSHRVWAERLEQIFSSFSQAHPNYYRIRYIGVADGGRELVQVDNHWGQIEVAPPASLRSQGERDFFKATLRLNPGEIYLSEFDLNREEGTAHQISRPTLRAATPVFTPSGEVFGIIVINMDVSGLLISAVSDLEGAQTYIANNAGQYLLHPDPRQAFRFEPGSNNRITTDFPSIEKMFSPQTPSYLPLGNAPTSAGNALVAAQRIYFVSDDPSRFLLLLYSIPGAAAAKHIATIPVRNIIGGFIAMFLVSGIALVVLRRTFVPLDKIAASADEIAAGNHDVKLPQYSGGEIGSLTNALNVMLTRLLERERLLLESEARYRRLHESMSDAYVMVDMSGRVLEFNRAYQELLGYTADELLRMSCVRLTPEKWHEFEARILDEQIVANNKTQVYEKEYIRKDGKIIPVELRAFLLRDKNNQPEAMWAIVRDITERNLVQVRLQKNQNLLKEAQRLGQLGSWELDLVTGELLWSDEVYRIFELDPAHFSPSYENFLNAVHPDDRDSVEKAYAESLKNRRPYDIVHRLLLPDGRIKWARGHGTSEFDASGKPLRSVGAVQDITAQKRAEEEIFKAGEKFRIFFESISDPVFIVDMEGRFIQANHSACERLGYRQAELLQMGPADIVSPEYAVKVPGRFKELKNDGALVFESAYVRRDGTVMPVEVNTRIIEYEGRPTALSVARDITERKRAKEELQAFFNLIPDMASIASTDGHFLKLNRAWQVALGFTEQELLDTPFLDFVHPEDRDATKTEMERLIGGESAVHFINRYRCKKGGYKWLEWEATPPVGNEVIYATARDITERRQTEKQLQRSVEEIADLYNHAPCGYHSLDRDGNILRINETELSWLGYTHDEVVGKIRWQELLVSSSLETFRQTFPQLMRQGFARDVEAEMIRKDGSTFVGLINATAIYDPLGNFLMSRSTIINITERKRVERQLQELSAHLQTAREDEKARIAREIHDELGGTLTALKMDAFWLAKNLPSDKVAAPLMKRANAMSKLLDSAVGVTRRIISDLRPTILDDLGLLAALEWQAAQFQKRTGIKCHVNGIENRDRLDRQHAIALFRIFQETLTNIARHSGASRVEVEFHCCDEEVMLSISDNGRGLPEGHTIAPTSYGLRGMSERVEQLGGKIRFDTPAGGGFSVTVTLPLHAEITTEGVA